MGFIKEFKEFAMKGNVLDLAIAVIIGSAFGKIVSSIVSDIIMPPIGLLLGKVDFKELKIVLQKGSEAISDGAKVITPAVQEVSINYGIFAQTIFDFILIALSIFIVLKAYQKFQKKKEEAPKHPPEPSNEEKLLTEIRDILKNKS